LLPERPNPGGARGTAESARLLPRRKRALEGRGWTVVAVAFAPLYRKDQGIDRDRARGDRDARAAPARAGAGDGLLQPLAPLRQLRRGRRSPHVGSARPGAGGAARPPRGRSEERRVGKECTSRRQRSQYQEE